MVFQHANKKRAVSLSGKWEDTLGCMMSFIGSPSLKSFNRIRLDRGYVQSMFRDFLTLTDGYLDVYEDALFGKLDRTEVDAYHDRVGLKHGNDMVQLVNHAKCFFREYLRTKDQIVKNYSWYLDGRASYDVAKSAYGTIGVDDLRANYHLAAAKAVNHYDPGKGTFKAYMDLWLHKVKLDSGRIEASRNQMQMSKRDMEKTGVLDDAASPERDSEKRSRVESMNRLAKVIDGDGFLSEYLGLVV